MSLDSWHKENIASAKRELKAILKRSLARPIPILTLNELGRARQLEYQIAKMKQEAKEDYELAIDRGSKKI